MRRRRRSAPAVTGVALAAAMAVSACTSGTSGTSGSAPATRVSGGIATVAELPQSPPNYIFPFVAPAYETVENVQQFQYFMYRPLYWVGVGASLQVNYGISLADAPVWNSQDDQVTIKLKPYKWSDGAALTPENVAFWVGLSRAERANSAYYTPGQFPDNLKSVTYNDRAGTVTFTLKSAVSPEWFLYDQLAQITPLPLAWDRTASSTRSGCSSEDAAIQQRSCAQVYQYLNGQAKLTSQYATDPLWQIVDGPFKLRSFSPDGSFTLVPNPDYSGSPKPSLAQVQFLPFTSVTAEYNSLLSGQSLSIGYVPSNVLKPKPISAPTGPNPLQGYTLDPVLPWGFSYLLINFNNPVVGPLFRQLYVRQALQSVVDQQIYIQKAANGYGATTYGPVPLSPASPFTAGMSAANPYPFSISHARGLLTAHGWTIPASGAASCADPGTGPGQCGAGIGKNQRLVLNLISYTGDPSVTEMMSQFSSDASSAGITVNVSSVPPQEMVADAVQCKPAQSACSWQIINYGSAVLYSYPSGAALFATGAGGNVGSYSSAEMDSLIQATLTSSDPKAIANYATYAAEQVPVLWQPTMATPVYEVKSDLKGVVPVSPLYSLTPENWYLTK